MSNNNSELVISLVGAIGTDLAIVNRILTDRLAQFNYTTQTIRISKDVIPEITPTPDKFESNFQRYDTLMTKGNQLREKTNDKSILAKAAVAKINFSRPKNKEEQTPSERKAYVISSLKNPEEVLALRNIYSHGFFLIGVHSNEDRRKEFLTEKQEISGEEASQLIARDADESNKFGQHTRDTYHLSDFFIDLSSNTDKLENDIWRILDLIFGKPFTTPTFDEFAMFMAFSSSLRSADLSRQVGAVITKDESIVSTGANDVPKSGGGLYWPEYDSTGVKIVDTPDGRDYMRGHDSNVKEKNSIINDIIEKSPPEFQDNLREIIKSSKIKDITEYGRIVHAEMEAILASSRVGISTKNADLYCTTFPCHNCAKHIVASGIKRVVYVEPYPKSKALSFHNDSISTSKEDKDKVVFESFVGVGPRSFLNLFSMNLGSGYAIKRKDDDGQAVFWEKRTAKIRMPMLPISYIDREKIAAAEVSKATHTQTGENA